MSLTGEVKHYAKETLGAKSFCMLGKNMMLAEMVKSNCAGYRVECGGACIDVCPAG